MFRTQTLASISTGLLMSLALLVGLYLYFVLSTVHFAGALREDVRAVRQLSIEISDLESEYTASINALTLDNLESLGFVSSSRVVYLGAERTVLAQIR